MFDLRYFWHVSKIVDYLTKVGHNDFLNKHQTTVAMRDYKIEYSDDLNDGTLYTLVAYVAFDLMQTFDIPIHPTRAQALLEDFRGTACACFMTLRTKVKVWN